jgi:5-methylcytosine-specific restriction protein A
VTRRYQRFVARPGDPNWRRWYTSAPWRKRSKLQLQVEPLCRFCAERGAATPATVADHVTPHRGDYRLFWFGVLQSLCAPCHNGRKARMEGRGNQVEQWMKDRQRAKLDYNPRLVGDDGWPLDPKHPANRRERR